MEASSIIQIILMGLLVLVTGIYAWRTHVISDATKQQADASIKMAEEMREQRIIDTRPNIIMRSMYKSDEANSSPDFDYFEIYNAANVPAIGVEISVFTKDQNRRKSEKRNFLGGYEKVSFDPEWNLNRYVGQTCYLVSEYQSIYSRDSKVWYQTWLPFKIGQIQGTDKIILTEGDLEFRDDVSEENRINAFAKPRGSKND